MRTLLVTLTTCLFVLSAHAAWPLYEPVAEVVLPPGDANRPRAVEEKEGYIFLLAREGILYTYDLRDLPLRTSFATYNTPVNRQTCHGNGNGVLRQGDYLYAFGGSGIQTIDVHEPNKPVLLGLTSGLNIYNLVRHENYLLAAGGGRLVVYSLAQPGNPTFVSKVNLGQDQLVWSAAGYGRTLYACHWWSDWKGTYVDTLSIIDFSDPAHLTVLKALNRDDEAYHLRVMGNRLLECTSNQVGLWDLTAPANPVFLTSQVAGARVAALSGDHLVTNGAVFRPDGNDLQVVATFQAGGSQGDGSPYGSAVNASFVFIAQSKRVLILNARPPVLTINYTRGGPGSFFTITGHGFPAKSKATILVNGLPLGEVAADAAGDCLFLLNAKQAGPGRYLVTTTTHPGTSVNFVIAAEEAVRPQAGTGTTFQIPSGIAYAKYSGGNGTAQDPYRIATAADLIALGETPPDYDKHFLLTADLDLDPSLPGRKVFDKAVIAPGAISDEGVRFVKTPFTGFFDGAGHSISHLVIAGRVYLGLFGKLESKITNLRLEAVEVKGTSDFVGALVGCNQGEIRDCLSTGSVTGGGWGVGGLVGINWYTIGNSHSACTVTGTYSGSPWIYNAYAVGGLAGHNEGTVTNSSSGGSVSGPAEVGGLVGWNDDDGDIGRCYSYATVIGNHNVGGLVGLNAAGDVSRCYSTAAVSGDQYVGGLAGASDGDISNCYSTAAVKGNEYVGGLVGSNDKDEGGRGRVLGSYSMGVVSGQKYVGGLVGSGQGTAASSFWDVDASGQTTSVGGIGKKTTDMRTAATFLAAGWDFVGETANGTEDIWWIDEGKDYPRLWWELSEGAKANP